MEFTAEVIQFMPPKSNPYKHDWYGTGCEVPGCSELHLMSHGEWNKKTFLRIIDTTTGEALEITIVRSKDQ